MQVSHTRSALSVSFDEPNIVGSAGLVPVMELARESGLHSLAGRQLTVPTDKGANAGAKVSALVAGMCAGADSIEDMAILRHGAMKRLFNACYAPSTLGSFLRSFTFGHVRQLDAVASRFLAGLADRAPLLGAPAAADSDPGLVFVDVDDTIIEVHGYQKQGSGYGYSGVRGLNALLATASTADTAPVILGQRLRKGSAGSPRGASRFVSEALSTLKRMPPAAGTRVLVRADSAFYGHPTVAAALTAGADVSVTVRMDKAVKAAIATIDDKTWTGIKYPQAIFDEDTGTWTSKAEVAEVPFTAFTSRKKAERIPGRLVVRKIPELNPEARPRAADAVRLPPVPRFLHHHRSRSPGYRGRRCHSPAARHHRAGQRRSQGQCPGPPALRPLLGQQCMAGLRGHGLQPHTGSRDPRRRDLHPSPHRHHPSQTRCRSSPDRFQ
ncbi:IS1380 family transposase [Citricoccus nitrophenolicus]